MCRRVLFLLILLTNTGVCFPQVIGYTDDEPEPAFVPRIVSGWPAQLGDVPYQLAFKSRGFSKWSFRTFCGGSLIGPNKVLSAAHCFEKKKSDCMRSCTRGKVGKKILRRTYVVAGNLMNTATYSYDSEFNGQWRKLRKMYIPPRYKFPRNDISVGFTRSRFFYNSYVSAIPIASMFRDYQGTCLASGFGRLSNRLQSERLMLAHLHVYPTSMCTRIHRKNMRKFVCTSDTVSDVHKGDSGGPLVCTNTGDPAEYNSRGLLVGVVSGNRYRSGSFFTRVSSFRRFIRSGSCFVCGDFVLILYGYMMLLLF